MKKSIIALAMILLASNVSYASFREHYDAGQVYFAQYQYSSAISEFKKALRINYTDSSARIGLINSYLARGTFLANTDKNYGAAANDFRAALFYLKYYSDAPSSQKNIENTERNLEKCLSEIKFNTSPDSRFKEAQKLRLKGLFAEAGYEFIQSVGSERYKGSAYEQAGDMMKVLGNTPKVSYYYKKALEINSGVQDLRLKYARALDKEGHGELALEEYNRALQGGDKDPETLYSLERIYRQKLSQNSKDASTLTNLGAILQKQNKYDEALKYYTLANNIQPDNVQNRMNIASLYYSKKDYQKALTAYDSILIVYPENIEANLNKAECLLALNRLSEAKNVFEKTLLLSNEQRIKSRIVENLRSKMALSDVISFVYGSNTPPKSDLESLYDYAYDLHKQNKLARAIESYQTILKYDSTNPEVYVNLAIAYNQQGSVEKANEIIQAAKEKFPTNKQVNEVLLSIQTEANNKVLTQATQYYNAKDYQTALSTYLSVSPQTVDSLSGAAACYAAMDDSINAIRFYQRAFEKKPNSDIAYYIGDLYAEKKDFENAKIYLNKSLNLNSSNQNAKELLTYVKNQENADLLNQAISLYEQKNNQAALQLFNKVIYADSDNAYARYYRASIYDEQKKYTLAIEDYKKALSNSKEFSIANYLIALDYDELKQYKNALLYYKKYISLTPETNEYKTYSQQRVQALKKYE